MYCRKSHKNITEPRASARTASGAFASYRCLRLGTLPLGTQPAMRQLRRLSDVHSDVHSDVRSKEGMP